MEKPIVILGGGFAGIEAAIKSKQYGYDVVVVSDRDYLFIYPVSIWIPVKKKNFNDVSIPLEKLAKKHGFELVIDQVKKIDHENNKVILGNSELEYSYLFIALGMSKITAPGQEHTHSICGHPEESITIRDILDKLVKQGKGNISVGFGGNPKDPTATAVRGGPAFELLFNISHYLKKKGIRKNFRLNFFAPMAEPGKRMGEKPLKKLGLFFEHYKVSTYVGKKIKRFEEDKVVFEDDSSIESDLTIFIPGGKGHPLFEESGLPVNAAGFIRINELTRVEGHPNIYAIGDAAAILGHPWAAKQGHIAEVMAKTAAFNVHQEISFKGKRKSYWEHLNIICMMDSGDGAAYIKRERSRETIIPLPIIGHWLKKGWGFYYKNSKLKRMPRIPGM